MTRYLIVCQTPERAWKLCKRMARHLHESGLTIRYSECGGKPFIDILMHDIIIDFVGDVNKIKDGMRYEQMYGEFCTEKWLDKRKGERK